MLAVARLAAFCERARTELGWSPAVLDIGGGLGIRYTRDEHVPTIGEFVGPLVTRLRELWPGDVQLVLEPGRSLVGRAGVTLYRVGAVKESGGVSYAAVDGGMSDNPAPQLYGARYEALLATRADELADGVFRIAGKHCETGDVLIDAAELPHPRRGDLLGRAGDRCVHARDGLDVQRRAAPCGRPRLGGEARVIRRRESTDDLLRYEPDPRR